MTVYIEYVIIDNMVLDSLIIYFTLRLARLKISPLRIILCACLGTALAILLSLISLHPIVMLLLRLSSGVLIVAFIARFNGVIHYLKTFLIFLGVTFLLGGVCFGALFLIEQSVERAIVMGYEKFPVGAIIAPLFCAALLTEYLIKRLKRFKHTQPFIYKIELYYSSERIEANGYLDSGNLLYDLSGNPIIVLSKDAAAPLIARAVLMGRFKTDTIPVKTVSGECGMKTFKTDKFVIYSGDSVNILYDVTVGITDRKFEGYSCLLHPAVVC